MAFAVVCFLAVMVGASAASRFTQLTYAGEDCSGGSTTEERSWSQICSDLGGTWAEVNCNFVDSCMMEPADCETRYFQNSDCSGDDYTDTDLTETGDGDCRRERGHNWDTAQEAAGGGHFKITACAPSPSNAGPAEDADSPTEMVESCGGFPPVGTCDEIAAMFISEECETLCSGARDYTISTFGPEVDGMERVCANSEVFMCMNEHTPGVCTMCEPAWGSPPDWGSPAQCTVAAGEQRLADEAAQRIADDAEEAAEPEDLEDEEPEDPEGEDPEDDDCDCGCQFRAPEQVMCCQLAQMSACATPPAGDLQCCNTNGACSDIAGAICECSNPIANRSPSPSPSNSAGSTSPEVESNSAGWCAKRTILTSMAIYSSMAVLLNDPV